MALTSDDVTTRGEADGDGDRLRPFVRSYGALVDSFLATVERDEMARDELWSDVFRIALGHLDELEALDESQVRTWLFRTVRNLTANATRAASARRRLVDRLSREPFEVEPAAEDVFFDAEPSEEAEERMSQVGAALEQLTSDQQEILGLDALGHRGPVIAKVLGCTQAAARVRLMRARRAFRAAYEQADESDDVGEGRP